jgi:prephenate dehydrogenase
LGLIDDILDLPEAARQADLIFLAAPVGAMGKLFEQMLPALNPHALITDGGSTKAGVVEAARLALGERVGQFVPGHPIAGSEASGPQAASADLYESCVVVLTPLPENTAAQRARLEQLWRACGARVVNMSPQAHDRALAGVSHVPHFLSSAYMHQLLSCEDADARLALAGSGFRDFTRIAAGSAELWRDIFLSNREAMLAELALVKASVEQAEAALRGEDAPALWRFLERAAAARRLWGGRGT